MKCFKARLAAIMLLLFLFSLLSAASCAPKKKGDPEPKTRIFYEHFDTVSVFYDYTGMDSAEFRSLADSVEAAISHYHKLFDIYHEYEGITNLATVNRLAGQGRVKVDPAIIGLLSFSVEMYHLTGGKVNIAMGAPIALWHELRVSASSEPRIPTEEELTALSEHISIDSIVIDKEALTVEITDPLVRIDVGAVAKGYTAELIKDELLSMGKSGLVLDMGGNLCAVGSKPSGEGWKSGIRNPLYLNEGEEPYVRTVILKNASLVTSGVYERYYTVNGVRYHHIIDPETLMPSYRYLSVTVQTEDSGVADALSTAIFNMDYEEAVDFIREFGKAEVTFVFNDGSYSVVNGA